MHTFEPCEQYQLLEVARRSIAEGMQHGIPLHPRPAEFSSRLQVICGNFVTLTLAGDLRGCIGSLQGHCPLLQNIADNAFNAAFRDPRFSALSELESPGIELEISLLSRPQAMVFADESDALAQLQAHVDGLILEVGACRATFLPSVWQQLPDAELFLRHLKRKAGLPEDYWSGDLQLQRYRSHSFSDVLVVASKA
jgi:hypothetical protein